MLPFVVASCATTPSDTDEIAQAVNGGKALLSLTHSNAALLQTSDTAWSLAKTGLLDQTHSTVTWTITATQGATSGATLIADGDIGVENDGNGAATIGNIVVNLQTKAHGDWVTQASDIADATHGDAATHANVAANASTEHHTSFSESSASGALAFMNARTDTVFSLVPEVSVPAHTKIRLLFSARFDNTVLHLAPGTKAHVEAIVTFGNAAGGQAQTDDNVDINGNGVIDPDEAKVRSVNTEIDKQVPAVSAANTTVTLGDAASSITTTGTVTLGTPTITLGATTGKVVVSYAPGASGGTVTNCATATGVGVTDDVGDNTLILVAPVELQACNTQTIGAVCTPGAPGCGWSDGDVVTYNQSDWGDPTNDAGKLMNDDFDSVYASAGGVFEIGEPLFIVFTGEVDLAEYLPASGAPGVLDSDLVNPSSSSSGLYGGEVAALKLNIDFTDAKLVAGTSGLAFGDLTLCGLAQTAINGMSVRSFAAVANAVLGGDPTAVIGVADAETLASSINDAFDAGSVDTFGQAHIVAGSCL